MSWRLQLAFVVVRKVEAPTSKRVSIVCHSER